MGSAFLFVERRAGWREAMGTVVFSAGVACFLRWYSAELVVIFCQVGPNYLVPSSQFLVSVVVLIRLRICNVFEAYRTKSVSHLGASAQVDAPFSLV